MKLSLASVSQYIRDLNMYLRGIFNTVEVRNVITRRPGVVSWPSDRRRAAWTGPLAFVYHHHVRPSALGLSR